MSDAGNTRYEILNTGIPLQVAMPQLFSWCDKDHIAALRKRTPESDDAQLVYLDLSKAQVTVIDTSHLGNGSTRIGSVMCEDGIVYFLMAGSLPDAKEKQQTRLFEAIPGRQPELIVEFRQAGQLRASIHPKAKYVIGRSDKRGISEGRDSCAVAFLRTDYKLLCWDLSGPLPATWPLKSSVLTEYLWEETVQVQGEDGKPKTIKNPQELRLRDGKPIYGQLELRDLDNRIIRPISMTNPNNVRYMMPAVSSRMRVSPDEKFLYTPCARIGDHDAKFTIYDRMCRQSLSSSDAGGNEVFSLHQNRNNDIGIGDFSIAKTGDLYFAGGSKNRGIWKFSASTGGVVQLTNPPPYHNDGSPQVSPDGMRVVFTRPHNGQTTLFIAKRPN